MQWKVIFLQSVKERIAEWEAHPYVHDLFTEKTSFLKLYNYYVSNHHKSLETIDACIEKYPLFAIFLRDLEAREKVELKVLLTEPLRRVSTYYLIVQVFILFYVMLFCFVYCHFCFKILLLLFNTYIHE